MLVESYPTNNPNAWVQGDMRIPTEATNADLIRMGKLYPNAPAVSLYHCPADKGIMIAGKRIEGLRSYSMNCFMGGRDSSVGPIPSTASGFIPFFSKESEILAHNPSRLFVFLDEDETTINDGFLSPTPPPKIGMIFRLSQLTAMITATLWFSPMAGLTFGGTTELPRLLQH